MMKNLVMIAAAMLLTTACSEQAPQAATTSVSDNQEIALNKGAKWKVNEEMKPYIQTAQEGLAKYMERNNGDYKAFALYLKEQNTALIQSCTMTGEAHDELHKWLHPHLELVDQLEQATTAEEAQETLKALESSFRTYDQYFE